MTDAQAYRFAVETWKRAYKYMTEHRDEFEQWKEVNKHDDEQIQGQQAAEGGQ